MTNKRAMKLFYATGDKKPLGTPISILRVKIFLLKLNLSRIPRYLQVLLESETKISCFVNLFISFLTIEP